MFAYLSQKRIWIVKALALTLWAFGLITMLPLGDFPALFVFLGLSLAMVLGIFLFYVIRSKASWRFCLFYLFILLLGCHNFLISTGMKISLPYIATVLMYFIFSMLLFMFVHYAFLHSLRIESLFIGMAFIIGVAAQVTAPKPGSYDEISHFTRAYYITEGDFLGGAKIMVPKEVGAILDSNQKENIFQAPSTDLVPSTVGLATVYPPTTYLPQIVGIMAAKFLNLSIFYTVHFARFALLLFFIIVMAQAIRISPINKTILLMIGMFPVVIKQAAYPTGGDPLIISLSFLFCAYIIYMNFKKEYKLEQSEKIGLAVLSIFISTVKISYLPILGFLFLVPHRCFRSTKEKYLFVVGTIVAAAILNLLWLAHSFHFLSQGAASKYASSGEQLAFILSNPLQYFIVFLRTVKVMLRDWIHVAVIGLFVFGKLYSFQENLLYLSLFFLLTPQKENKTWIFTSRQWIWIALIIGGTVAIISTSLYLQWTPLKQSTIDGIQGRYFLPFAFFILSFIKLIIPFRRSYKIEKYAILALGTMSLVSALDAFLT